jgi:lysine/arginine/ornithine transport system substrate-binding protein
MLSVLRFGGWITSAVLLASAAPALPAPQYFPRANKPASYAVRVGDNVYISGVTGQAADGTLPADFTAQATNAMDGVVNELKLAGATVDDVYKCQIALVNMDNFDAFNAVYRKYFKPDRLPARMSWGVTTLGGSAVEVQCEAHIGS